MSGSQAALFFLRLATAQREAQKPLKIVLIAIVAPIIAVALLLSAILSILTAPFEYDGITGEFQSKYAYLVSADSEALGDALDDESIEALVAAADTNDPDRQNILRTALSLVGRVPYFWGGKSAAGWNDKWNTMQRVTAPGVSSSGTLRPYGLDCSGFTDWVWRTAGFKSIGAGVHAQFWASERITAEELQPGDLVFKNWPDNNVINHVGIYYGKDENGKNLYIHCSSSGGGVVMDSYAGFKLWGRPKFERKEET